MVFIPLGKFWKVPWKLIIPQISNDKATIQQTGLEIFCSSRFSLLQLPSGTKTRPSWTPFMSASAPHLQGHRSIMILINTVL